MVFRQKSESVGFVKSLVPISVFFFFFKKKKKHYIKKVNLEFDIRFHALDHAVILCERNLMI